MTVFPQLSTGATAQFPFERELRFRTLVQASLDGVELRTTEDEFEERRWQLTFEDLTGAEWQQLQTFFEEAEGRLGEFVFLDPGGNLLRWTDRLDDPAWETSGVSLSAGGDDPLDDTTAWLVSGSGALTQRIAAPASLVYVASVWAREASPGAALRFGAVGGLSKIEFSQHSDWRRYQLPVAGGGGDEIEFRLEPAGSVQIFGPQVEAQRTASSYKPSGSQGGVYPHARFDQDSLADASEGPGRHSTIVRISWRPSKS